MAASLLDQNSRSLFHKQRVRAFFSPNFFDTADPAGYAVAASRRLVSGASKDSRAGISRALFCPFRRGARLCPHSQLLRSPSKPVTTITASNPWPDSQVLDHCVVYDPPPRRICSESSESNFWDHQPPAHKERSYFWTWVDSFSLDLRPETTLSKLVTASLHENASQLFVVIKRLVWGVGTWFKSMEYLGVISCGWILE